MKQTLLTIFSLLALTTANAQNVQPPYWSIIERGCEYATADFGSSPLLIGEAVLVIDSNARGVIAFSGAGKLFHLTGPMRRCQSSKGSKGTIGKMLRNASSVEGTRAPKGAYVYVSDYNATDGHVTIQGADGASLKIERDAIEFATVALYDKAELKDHKEAK